MSDKVVLPKFDLPGDRTHPAVKALWAIVGVFVLCLLALGGALWHQHSLQLAAEKRQSDLVAARLAEANAAAEASKARAAEAAAKVSADQARAAEKLAAKNAPAPVLAAAGGDAGKAAPAAGKRSHHRGGPSKGASSASKTVAKADDKKATPKTPESKRDDAAIDKLLASFKK